MAVFQNQRGSQASWEQAHREGIPESTFAHMHTCTRAEADLMSSAPNFWTVSKPHSPDCNGTRHELVLGEDLLLWFQIRVTTSSRGEETSPHHACSARITRTHYWRFLNTAAAMTAVPLRSPPWPKTPRQTRRWWKGSRFYGHLLADFWCSASRFTSLLRRLQKYVPASGTTSA